MPVAFEDNQSSRLATCLELGSDLPLALGTDDVDVVDLKTALPSFVRTVFRNGDLLVETEIEPYCLRSTVLERKETDPRSAAEQFDDALAAIDDHLA